MKIILKESVDTLGKAGDIVKVKPGYGRNYLIPKGLGVLATPSTRLCRALVCRVRLRAVYNSWPFLGLQSRPKRK